MNKKANVIYFVFGMAVMFVLYTLIVSSTQEFENRIIQLFVAIGTFGAVIVALYQISLRVKQDKELREERNKLAFKMLKDPVDDMHRLVKSFIDDVGGIVTHLEHRSYADKAFMLRHDPDFESNHLKIASGMAMKSQSKIDSVDFSLIRSKLDYLLSSDKETNEVVDNLFKVLQHQIKIGHASREVKNLPPNFDDVRIVLLRSLVKVYDDAFVDVDRLRVLVDKNT